MEQAFVKAPTGSVPSNTWCRHCTSTFDAALGVAQWWPWTEVDKLGQRRVGNTDGLCTLERLTS